MSIPVQELKVFLDEKVSTYNHPGFIQSDPIRIPSAFFIKEDVEIAGFLAASIAWGNRKSILKSAGNLMELMDQAPFEFVMTASDRELGRLRKFVHRTFNGQDCLYFISALRHIYRNHGGLENVFQDGFGKKGTVHAALSHFYSVFFELQGERTRKHISNVEKGSSAKRLNMFLRWMVRKDNGGVDFGLWKGIPSKALMLPLDVHTGNVGRKLGLLTRKSNDWKAVEEITANLRLMDRDDPVKYDYALFGLGVFEKF